LEQGSWNRALAELPDPLPIAPAARAFRGAVRPPGSKSLTNRALLLAALARGRSVLRGALLEADDAERMIAAITTLGATVEKLPGGELGVTGVNGRWRVAPEGVRLDLNNAGTATRFLAAASLLSPAPVVVDGNARMRERPIGELASALVKLGAGVEYVPTPGGKPLCPPVRVTPPERAALCETAAHMLEMPTTQSSQFISALLMIGPWLESGLTIRLTGAATSGSYIRMTLGLLEKLGAVVRTSDDLRVMRVAPPTAGVTGLARSGGPRLRLAGTEEPPAGPREPGLEAFTYDVEPDASGATYFWAAAALVPGATCDVLDLPEQSLQGDAQFVTLLEEMGCIEERPGGERTPVRITGPRRLKGIETDMADMPDAAMTLAVVAAFAEGPTEIRGIRTLKVKESDRGAAVRDELAKIGVKVEFPLGGDEDAMRVTPPKGGVDCSAGCPRVEFETYHDHRMAMSLALVGLRRPNVWIKDPGCVGKTYPGYWRDLGEVVGKLPNG
jgi:3-phosphoshikimate 1-carboxyvinyltransferase